MADQTPVPVIPPDQTSIVPYAVTAIILILIDVILCGVIIWLRPTYDPLAVITGVSLAFTAIATSMWNLIRGQIATQQQQVTTQQLVSGQQAMHEQMNGKLAALLTANSKAANAEGHAAGMIDEQARAAAVQKALGSRDS